MAKRMDTTCCYALQDKIWVTDPDGHKWEFFHVIVGDVTESKKEYQSHAAIGRFSRDLNAVKPLGGNSRPSTQGDAGADKSNIGWSFM